MQLAAVLTVEPPASEDEAHLVRAAQGGDSEAFNALVRAHSARVYRFLHRMTRQREDAEDLTQQTFLKAYRHLGSLDLRRPLVNWLLTIARRTALNHFRAGGRCDPLLFDAPDTGPAPNATAEARDTAANLWDRARETLSAREYEALWLRFGEDLSTGETARVMNLTVPHIKVLVFRAKRALTKGMKA